MAVKCNSGNFLGKRALVIGGRIAGKLAAKVLSDFYQEVIILDKDPKVEKQATRPGVPQETQGHALLKSGEEILELLFPGIVKELIEDGSVKSDFANDITWNHHGKWKIQYQSGFSIIQQSRTFLESHIQKRLEKIPNIRFLLESQVRNLLINDDFSEVTGVRVFEEDGTFYELMSELVIDASGAGSQIPTWIEHLGYSRPNKTEVKVNLFYASRIYHSLPYNNNNNHRRSVLVYPDPPLKKCGGGLSPIENQRSMVTLFGYGFDKVPSTEAEFLKFAKNLSQSDIFDLIVNGQAENEISVYRFPALRRFHYEKLKHFPNRLIVIGDAFCRIDPVFGQGMSIAALEALALHKELNKKLHKNDFSHISKKVHSRFGKIVSIPWLIALSEDFRYPHTEGVKPAGLSFLMWYVKKVILACADVQDVYSKLIKVLHLKAHPITLFAPSVLKAVLFKQKGSIQKEKRHIKGVLKFFIDVRKYQFGLRNSLPLGPYCLLHNQEHYLHAGDDIQTRTLAEIYQLVY